MELLEYRSATVTQDISNPVLSKVIDFVTNHDFSDESAGIHPLSDDFYYNLIEMTTTTSDERVWESHRDFYDVHIILEGEERIAYNHLSNMTLTDYDKEGDWQQMTGEGLFELILTPGKILLLDPNDAHQTGLIVDEAKAIRKLVFKVKI